MIRGSFTWKYGGKGVRKSGLKRAVILVERFILCKYRGKGFRMEMWRKRFQEKLVFRGG